MVRLYKKEDHDLVSTWLKSRGMKPIPHEVLSSTGIVVDETACGFLYFTNSCIGYLEHYISNPKAPQKERAKALELITDELIGISKKVGVKILIAGTNFQSIERLALKKGFKMVGRQTVLMRGDHE